MQNRFTLNEYIATHQVTSSGESIVDMYWNFVQYKLYNIIICGDRSFDVVNDTISDAEFGLRHIDIQYQYNNKTPIFEAYRKQFLFIIKILKAL